MRTRIALVAVGLLTILLAPRAYALKTLITMTPAMTGETMSLKMTALDEGRTRFTITRDPSAAREPANSDLQLVRGASLKVYGEDGLVVRCPVASREKNDGTLVYSFELNDKLARRSRFTLSEIEDYRPGRGLGGYIGGGTIYEFALIDFIEPGARDLPVLPESLQQLIEPFDEGAAKDDAGPQTETRVPDRS